PEQIPQQILSILKLREIPDRSLLDVLVDYLRYKQALLLLDNCEHLINACASLAQKLLQECPNLTILATSREGLGIAGERIYQVPSLSIPAFADIQAGNDLLSYEAVRLFVERARAVFPEFQPTPANSTAIVQICQRLDGIPLAVELAAARIRMLSPEQIAARLKDHFRLLAGGSRTALPRQQTLQALIDWSWDLLSTTERTLLRRLAVFAGGWVLEAAEVIVYLPDEEGLDVFEGLFSLVNKSLVIAEHRPEEETRYRLLETIRQYALERLIEAREIIQLRQQHAAFYSHLAIEAGKYMQGKDIPAWLVLLDADYSNIRIALEWNLEHQPLSALEMVLAIQQYFIRRLASEEGQNWSEQAFNAVQAVLPTLDGETLKYRQAQMAIVRAWQSMLLMRRGGGHQWVRFAKQAVEYARQSQDQKALSLSLSILGFVSAYANQPAEAAAYAQEGLEIGRRVGNIDATGMALGLLVILSKFVNHLKDKSAQYLEESRQWIHEHSNQVAEGSTLLTLGQFLRMDSQYQEAIHIFEESLKFFESLGDRYFINVARSQIGHSLRQMGDFDLAMDMYRETILVWQDLGNRGALANQLECIAFVAIGKNQFTRAAILLGAAEAIRAAVESPRVMDEQIEFDEAMASLRQSMENGKLDTALENGQRMGLEEAIAYALAEAG
ncbi:MAG TPA: hypothetical protein VLA49_04055, partial [Anaerolineales bacterium]|nr:hypothetical protein [Anaerolineales bacterium]